MRGAGWRELAARVRGGVLVGGADWDGCVWRFNEIEVGAIKFVQRGAICAPAFGARALSLGGRGGAYTKRFRGGCFASAPASVASALLGTREILVHHHGRSR